MALHDALAPKMLTDAIEVKAQAEQESARMQFVLSKAEQEAKRKQIEAKGISTFQHIVSEGISKELLMWKGIEATERIAESANAKIVMMGNSEKGMPVLLSSGDAAPIAVPVPAGTGAKQHHETNKQQMEPQKEGHLRRLREPGR